MSSGRIASFLASTLGLALLTASVVHAEHPGAAADSAGPNQAWVELLSRRTERLSPVLMGALSSARKEDNPELAHCFDRALRELHSVARQVSFHVHRLRESQGKEPERSRHERALNLLNARIDYLAGSVERCLADGVELRSGQTEVQVSLPPS